MMSKLLNLLVENIIFFINKYIIYCHVEFFNVSCCLKACAKLLMSCVET